MASQDILVILTKEDVMACAQETAKKADEGWL